MTRLSTLTMMGGWFGGAVYGGARTVNLVNSSFEKPEVAPWVLKLNQAKVSFSEEGAHEGKKALVLETVNPESTQFRAILTQTLAASPDLKLQPSIWMRGGQIEEATLSIRCYNAMFSQSEDIVIGSGASSETWAEIKSESGEAILLPDFTTYIQFRLELRSKANGSVWVDDASLGLSKNDENGEKEATTADSTNYLKINLPQFQEKLHREKPNVLIMGDASVLEWNRTASQILDELGDDSRIVVWGFPSVSTHAFSEPFNALDLKLVEGAKVVLSFGYFDLLNGSKDPKQSVRATKKILSKLKEHHAGLEIFVLPMLSQHPQVADEWKELVDQWNEKARLEELPLLEVPGQDKGTWIQENHLPNVKARAAFAKELIKKIKPESKKAEKP